MTDYTKTTNFTAKDSLPSGNAAKKILGSLFDTEFDNIATAVASKYDSADLGSVLQAYDAGLTSIAGLTTAADRGIYTTASDTYAVFTLTSFARSILDDADASTVRSTIGVDASGTDNSTNVTLAGSYDYLSLSGQEITLGQIDLTTDVTGDLPVTEGGTGASDAATARTNLGVAIGSDVQAYDADTAKTDVAQTWTANQTFGELTETDYNLTGTDIDPANGSIQYKTLSGNTTFTESLADGQSVTLMIDDGTAYTITWPTMTWLTSDGSAPTLQTSGYTVIEIWQVNSTVYGRDLNGA